MPARITKTSPFTDAMTYVKLLKEGGNLIGKPVFEIAG